MYNSLRQLFYCNIQVHRSINVFYYHWHVLLFHSFLSERDILEQTNFQTVRLHPSTLTVIHYQYHFFYIRKDLYINERLHPIHITTPCDINHRFWIPNWPGKNNKHPF